LAAETARIPARKASLRRWAVGFFEAEPNRNGLDETARALALRLQLAF
jgi:hypothetical protein